MADNGAPRGHNYRNEASGHARVHNGNIINNSYSVLENECQKFLRSLRLTDPLDDLEAIRRIKGEGVRGSCRWLLHEDKYVAWETGDELQLLLLQGGPGIGKTMISSFLINQLEQKATLDPAMTFMYYFCDNKDETRNTGSALLRSLMLQLLRKRPALFKYAQRDYDEMKDKLSELFRNIDALWRIFRSMLEDEDAGKVYVLVDALDECERSSRQAFLIHLRRLFQRVTGNQVVKFLIACRPEMDIEDTLYDIGDSLRIHSAKINADLFDFINIKVDDLPRRYSTDLKQEIRDALIQKAGGTFLWVSLVLDGISKTKTISKVRAKLFELPSSLSQVYERILRSIDDESKENAIITLKLVVIARRPLTTRELAMARALDKEDWKQNEAILPSSRDIQELKDDYKCCEPLLYHDAKTDTINLVHQSVKDYLLGEDLRANIVLPRYHIVEDDANILMFQICWRYLNVEEFDHDNMLIIHDKNNQLKRVKLAEELLDSHDFLLYAADEWHRHALAARHMLVIKDEFKKYAFEKCPNLRDFLLLEAAQFGHMTLVKLLLDRGADFESKSRVGFTPLSMAIKEGHEAIVEILLDKGADFESRDILRQTPLLIAIQNGHEKIVKILLDKGADFQSSDVLSQTPLLMAIRNGHEEIVKILLDKGANFQSGDISGETPLLMAIGKGYKGIVQILLDKGADPESQNRSGMTPLSMTIRSGQEGIVKILLDKGADPESKITFDRTRSPRAVESGNKAVVNILPHEGVD